MLRTTHPSATTIQTRRGIDSAGVRRNLISGAMITFAVMTTAGCGDSKRERAAAERARAILATPAVVSDTTPTTESGSVIPENLSYEDAEAAYTGRRYGEAMRMFALYTKRRPENPWGHYMLGLSAWKAGEPARAESAFVAALERDPRHVKSLLNLSRVLLEMDRPEDALAKVTAALELDPESSDGHRLMGRVQSERGQTEEALQSYRRALAVDEEDAWSMNNMGLLLIRQGRFEEALGPLARAVQLKGDVAVFQNNLGIALERTGHVAQAAEAYRSALAADGSYQKASVSLARVGDRVDAPDVAPVDLASLADSFARDVQQWRETPTIGASPANTDSTSPEGLAPDISTAEPPPIPDRER